MFKWSRNLTLFASMLFYLPLFSQTATSALDQLAERLNSSVNNLAPEQIYLQTSKGIYESGEDLWFKAYVLDAQTLIPSSKSQTLYLQLINENNKKPIWQESYEIKNCFADGQVYLPDSLAEGDYLLEAFTANSITAGNSRFNSLRKVRIKKDMKPVPGIAGETKKQGVNEPEKNIQFGTFPEGGRLIAGIESRLAFKAVNPAGEPVAVSGTLFQDDRVLQEFKAEHAGMGSLVFTPLAGKRYHIRLSAPRKDSLFMLPAVQAEGVNLRLTGRDSSDLEFTVARSGGSTGMIYLRGQLRGQTACIASGMLGQQLKVRIPLKEFLGQGIAEFTLFDESLKALAERLVYVHPKKQLYIKAELSKTQYALREKATLKIKVSDEHGAPVVANLGLSIYDKLYLNPKDPKNILTHCYLSSQLKGSIYDPAFYFDEKQQGREKALDLLLLTQGWRNYVWSEDNLSVNEKAGSEVLTEGTTGEVQFTKKLKQAPQGVQFVKVFSPDETGNIKHSALIQADAAGKFMITPEDLQAGQGSYVYLKPMGVEDFAPRISLSNPFQTINKWMTYKERDYPLANVLEKRKEEPFRLPGVGPRVVKLGEVMVKGRGTSVFRDKYLGKLDSLAKADLNTDFVCHHPHHVLNCFEHKTDPRDLKPVEDKSYNVLLGKNGEILGVDHPGPFFFGAKKIIYHYPKLTEEELLKRNNLSRIKGYYGQREFYQPDYDKEPAGDGLPDARNTLLWVPSVITDKNGEASLEFFCSDINTGFVGKIEGISGEGLLGMAGFEFRVFKTENLKQGK